MFKGWLESCARKNILVINRVVVKANQMALVVYSVRERETQPRFMLVLHAVSLLSLVRTFKLLNP